MNSERNLETKAPRSYRLGALFAIYLVVCQCVSLPLAFSIQALLFLGWIPFLNDVLGKVRWHPPSLLSGLVCVTLTAAIIHFTGRALYAASREDGSPRSWKLRWTLAVLAGPFLMFASGLLFYGILHAFLHLPLQPGEP